VRSGLSSVATLVAFSLAVVPALAQVTVSPQLAESALSNTDFQKQFQNKQALKVELRPNGPDPIPYFVYAQNPHATQDRTLVVELRGEAKGELLAEGRAEKVPAGNWKVIRFAKPATPPASPPQAAAPGAAPAPVEPPPPGVPVARGTTGFSITLKLFDIDDKGARNEVKVAGAAVEQTLKVEFQKPTDYVKVDDLVTGTNKTASIQLTPLQQGKSAARITFPKSPGELPPKGVVGLFAATLDKSADGGAAIKLGGQFPDGLVPMNLAIDGVERVAVYDLVSSGADKSEVKALTTRRVRVVPVGVAEATRPTTAYPVRVETDNARTGDTLELRIRRKGDTVASDEVIPLGGPRDERLWVDPAEPTKQGLGFTTRTNDWVKALDLSAARGEMEVEAVLKHAGMAVTGDQLKGQLKVIVDADPPAVSGTVDVGDPAKPKQQLVKGEALPVRATVLDVGGAGVKQVTYVLFSRLQPDGTLPPDAVVADAVRLPKLDPKTKKPSATEFTDVWAAELTPPADKRGKFFIAAVAADNAGNVSKVTKFDPGIKVIELVDAVPGLNIPRGSIAGIVIHGGLPQPGLKVVVGGLDGKAKAVAETDAKGRFCIPDVLPGVYTVLTLKTDSNKGFSSQADVTVEPEKVSRVTLELIRNKDGR
jgi:hypothetical protein